MFRVGVTGDFLKADGTLGFGDIGLDLFEGSDVSWEFLPTGSEVLPEQARDYDGLLVLAPRVTTRTLSGVKASVNFCVMICRVVFCMVAWRSAWPRFTADDWWTG